MNRKNSLTTTLLLLCYRQISAITTTKISSSTATGIPLTIKQLYLLPWPSRLEDSFRKYKIGHRSYSLCLGIRFIVCSEYLYSDLSALDLLDFRSTFVPTFHFRIQEAQESTFSPNSSHPQFQIIYMTDTMTFFPTE